MLFICADNVYHSLYVMFVTHQRLNIDYLYSGSEALDSWEDEATTPEDEVR